MIKEYFRKKLKTPQGLNPIKHWFWQKIFSKWFNDEITFFVLTSGNKWFK